MRLDESINAQLNPHKHINKMEKKENAVMVETDLGPIEAIGITAYVKPIIVERSVMERLAELLDRTNLKAIKHNHMDKVRDTHTIEEFVNVLQEELSFQATVNVLTKVKGPKVLGKIDLTQKEAV